MAGDMPRAEAEVKYALTPEEYRLLPARLASLGFTRQQVELLTDYYLDFSQSPPGKWNFTRLRVIGGERYLLTKKRWHEDAQGRLVRLEEEEPLDPDEAKEAMGEAVNPLMLEKERVDFVGEIDGEPAVVALDHLVLGGRTYDFLECEVMTTTDHAHATRERLARWTHDTLDITAPDEASSMLELILEQLGGD